MTYKDQDFVSDQAEFATYLDWALSIQVAIESLVAIKDLSRAIRPSFQENPVFGRALWTSVIVAYSHLFVPQKTRFGKKTIKLKHLKALGDFDLELHNDLIDLRNKLVGHSDQDFHKPRVEIIKFKAHTSEIYAGLSFRGIRMESVVHQDGIDKIIQHVVAIQKYCLDQAQEQATKIEIYYDTIKGNFTKSSEVEGVKLEIRSGEVSQFPNENLRKAKIKSIELRTLQMKASQLSIGIPTKNEILVPAHTMTEQEWNNAKRKRKEKL